MKIQILSLSDAVLFEYEADENSVKITLGIAVSRGASLRGASLRGASLRGAELVGADLHDASLRGASLRGASLRGADLHDANLVGADLHDANLRGADLVGANLVSANLVSANLVSANLVGANLGDEKRLTFSLVPEEGAFIGWKKLKGGVIAKLQIPAKAKRTSSLVGRKNRAEYVKVLALFGADVGLSRHDGVTEYRKGAIVKPDSYDPDIRLECTNGIHFFITRKEAENYE